MQFESVKDQKLKEDLAHMFGDGESSKDMRQAIYMARKGLVNDAAISEYVRLKEQERREYLEFMPTENPAYAFLVGDALLSLDKAKEDDDTTAAAKHGDSGNDGGDKDVILEH